MRLLFLTITMILLYPFICLSNEITLAWDPNSEPDIAKYHIYQTSEAGVYSGQPVATVEHPVVQVTLKGLIDGVYFWSATAEDTTGNESKRSNEVTHTFYMGDPVSPGGLRKKIVIEIPIP